MHLKALLVIDYPLTSSEKKCQLFASTHLLWLPPIKTIYSEVFEFCLVVDFDLVIILCSIPTKGIIIISQSVIFKPPVFHPVINMDTGELDVKRAFPKWR